MAAYKKGSIAHRKGQEVLAIALLMHSGRLYGTTIQPIVYSLLNQDGTLQKRLHSSQEKPGCASNSIVEYTEQPLEPIATSLSNHNGLQKRLYRSKKVNKSSGNGVSYTEQCLVYRPTVY